MKTMFKKLVVGSALVFSSVVAMAQQQPIKIGSVLSVTGPAAFLGDPQLKTFSALYR